MTTFSEVSTTVTPKRAAIGAAVVAAAVVVTFAFCSGADRAHRADRRAAVSQVLQNNDAKLVIANAAAETLHAGVVGAAAALKRTVVADTAARHAHAIARTRVVLVNDTTVAIDSAAPVAVPAPLVALVRTADNALAADKITLDSSFALIDSLVRDTVAIARARDLYHERADTLQHALEADAPAKCGGVCKAAVVGVLGAIAYNVARQVVRHLFVGAATPE